LKQVSFFPEQAMFNHEGGVVMPQVLQSQRQTMLSQSSFESRVRNWMACNKISHKSGGNKTEECVLASSEEELRIPEIFESF
jgi:hypothetical protein